MKTLTLTSPPMRGPEVTHAQKRLNAFGAWAGAEDGVFGETTARACSQAKYMLGYAEKDIRPTYGALLESYLSGRRKPSMLMRRRAEKRKAAKSPGRKALDYGMQFIGVKENPPHSNRTVFSEWYGIIGPWCMMFVTYLFVMGADSKWFKRGSRWAYCPYVMADAKNARNGLIEIPWIKVQQGDIALFSFKRDGVAAHVGIVATPIDVNGNFKCLEGNTSYTDNANGGEVMMRQRNRADVICFARVAD